MPRKRAILLLFGLVRATVSQTALIKTPHAQTKASFRNSVMIRTKKKVRVIEISVLSGCL